MSVRALGRAGGMSEREGEWAGWQQQLQAPGGWGRRHTRGAWARAGGGAEGSPLPQSAAGRLTSGTPGQIQGWLSPLGLSFGRSRHTPDAPPGPGAPAAGPGARAGAGARARDRFQDSSGPGRGALALGSGAGSGTGAWVQGQTQAPGGGTPWALPPLLQSLSRAL